MIPTKTDLRVTKARGSDETGELHWTTAYAQAALCGAENQRRATLAERDLYLAPHCFTCTEDKRLSEDG